MLKHGTLGLVSRLAKSVAQDFNQLKRDLRLFPQQWQKITSLDDEQLAICCCDGVCCSWTTVEQRNLSENGSFADQVEDRVVAVDRRPRDFHGSFGDREQTGTRITLCENGGGSCNRFR